MAIIFMKKYQLVLLLKSDLSKTAKDKVLTEAKKTLGKISKEKVESLGEKKLAYVIKGNQKGEYVLLNFESELIPKEFEKAINIVENILRYLLIRK